LEKVAAVVHSAVCVQVRGSAARSGEREGADDLQRAREGVKGDLALALAPDHEPERRELERDLMSKISALEGRCRGKHSFVRSTRGRKGLRRS
jgi:hypothetical protein